MDVPLCLPRVSVGPLCVPQGGPQAFVTGKCGAPLFVTGKCGAPLVVTKGPMRSMPGLSSRAVRRRVVSHLTLWGRCRTCGWQKAKPRAEPHCPAATGVGAPKTHHAVALCTLPPPSPLHTSVAWPCGFLLTQRVGAGGCPWLTLAIQRFAGCLWAGTCC